MSMRLMCANDEGKFITLQEVIDGFHSKANRIPSTKRWPKAIGVQDLFLKFIGRIAPKTIRGKLPDDERRRGRWERDLDHGGGLMLVWRIHTEQIWERQNCLKGSFRCRRGQSWDAAMDAKDVMIDHSSYGKAIKTLINFFPNTFTQFCPETILSRERERERSREREREREWSRETKGETHFALKKKWFCFVMIFPAIDTSRLVIPSEENEEKKRSGKEGGKKRWG
jgi:hypothetical protein